MGTQGGKLKLHSYMNLTWGNPLRTLPWRYLHSWGMAGRFSGFCPFLSIYMFCAWSQHGQWWGGPENFFLGVLNVQELIEHTALKGYYEGKEWWVDFGIFQGMRRTCLIQCSLMFPHLHKYSHTLKWIYSSEGSMQNYPPMLFCHRTWAYVFILFSGIHETIYCWNVPSFESQTPNIL